MFDPKAIENIAGRIASSIPPGFSQFKDDMEKNLHALLQSSLSRLDLVSREEFEVQKAVLAKTRNRLEELEKQVAELERQILQD
ncbi:MAG: accessory factor UbiK family protein [Methylococcales bacterium]|nr:accessory factor UbiK family protein [Methylococcales bacterium]